MISESCGFVWHLLMFPMHIRENGTLWYLFQCCFFFRPIKNAWIQNHKYFPAKLLLFHSHPVMRKTTIGSLEPLYCPDDSDFALATLIVNLLISNSPKDYSGQGIYCSFNQEALTDRIRSFSIKELSHKLMFMFQWCWMITKPLRIL